MAIQTGHVIAAADVVDKIRDSINGYVNALKQHSEGAGNFSSNKEFAGDTDELERAFTLSEMDKIDMEDNGRTYCNSYLTNTRKGQGILARAAAMASNYGVVTGNIISAQSAANYVLSSFALATCIRQAYYRTYYIDDSDGDVKTYIISGYSMFNNHAEPAQNDANNRPIWNKLNHIAQLSSSCVSYYNNDARYAKATMWYNHASTNINATIRIPSESDPTVLTNVALTAFSKIPRAVSGQINITVLSNYGWKNNDPVSEIVVNAGTSLDGTASQTKLSNRVKSLDNYAANAKGTSQTIYVSNIISASSMNMLVNHTVALNKHIASAYYGIYSNVGLFDGLLLTCTYIIPKEILVAKSGGSSPTADFVKRTYIVKGRDHTVKSWEALLQDTPWKKRSDADFDYWELTWATSGDKSSKHPGDRLLNVTDSLTLLFKTKEIEITNLSGELSWGYAGKSKNSWGVMIGEDGTEYTEEGAKPNTSKLDFTHHVKYSAHVPFISTFIGGCSSAFIRWRGNKNYGNTSNGIIQRWVTFNVYLSDLTDSPCGGYKYFRLNDLSVCMNQNSPTHLNTWTYLVDLNMVDAKDLDSAMMLKNYGSSDSSTKDGDTQRSHEYNPSPNSNEPGGNASGYRYWKTNYWRDTPWTSTADGCTPPFTINLLDTVYGSGNKRSTNYYINPFSRYRRFHVYPILGYCISHSWWCQVLKPSSKDCTPYHSKAYNGESVGRGSCVRSLCVPLKHHWDVYGRGQWPTTSGEVRRRCPTSTNSYKGKLDSSHYGYSISEYGPALCWGDSNARSGVTIGGEVKNVSENVVFRVDRHGMLRIAIYISRQVSDQGGADQSWGEYIKGYASNTYPGSGMQSFSADATPPTHLSKASDFSTAMYDTLTQADI